MISQNIELARLITIIITQSFISILLYYLSLRILLRKFNRITFTLCVFYILPATGFILNLIFLYFSKSIIGFVIYFIAAFLIIFGFIFLVVFIIMLINLEQNFKLKKQVYIIFSYGIITLIALLYPGGITINESTNWVPKFSWIFLIIYYLIFTFFIFIPTIFLSIKLYKSFQDKNLKKKLRLFFIGIIGMFFAFYGLILYNTWHDSFFRAIWAFIVFILVVPSCLLIYYGIGKNI